MDNLPLLLLLLGSADLVFSTMQCNGGKMTISPELNEQLHTFEQVHKVANLTLHCVPVSLASSAVRLYAESLQDNIQSDQYCKYTFAAYNGYTKRWLQEYLMKGLPYDKIAQTAILHPGAKYGCAAMYKRGTWSYHYHIACIYEKISQEKPCYIEWDITNTLKKLQ